MIKKIFLLSLILFFQSCTKISNENLSIDELKINLNDEIESIKLSQIIENEFDIIALETNNENLIGRVDKLIIYDKYIFILDSFLTGTLFMFDIDGKFISKIGVKGSGPGEYTRPIDFVIDENYVSIIDNGNRTLTYDFKGNFVKEKRFNDFSAFKLLKINNNKYGFISGGTYDNLIITDGSFNVLESHFPYINRTVNVLETYPLFKNENNISFYRRYLNDTIYSISNEVVPNLIINYADKSFNINDYIGLNNADNKIEADLYDYCYTYSYFEGVNHRYLAFAYEDQSWLHISNKNSNEFKLFKANNLLNDITFEDGSYVTGIHKDKFIYLIQPQDLIESLKNNNDKLINNKILEGVKKYNKEDNPILLLVKYKI